MCAGLILALTLTPACQPKLNALEKVQRLGILTVVTRNSPSTYFYDKGKVQDANAEFDINGTPDLGQPTGFEYELVKQFANEIGVSLVIEEQQTLGGILDSVKSKRAQLAAAGLSITEKRRKSFLFTSPYQQITQRLVYRKGAVDNPNRVPKNITDLIGRRIVVMAQSSHAERLSTLKKTHPQLKWVAKDGIDSEGLMRLVFENEFDLTIVDSNEFAVHQALMPELTAAFDLGEPESVAWAFDRTEDDSLYQAAENFLASVNQDGRLEALKERFFGHMDHQFNYVGAKRFLRHIKKRLPEFEENFRDAATLEGLDWRLLAAVSYQESLWDPEAKSPTGVRGLMMLTLKTAKDLNIANRTDPKQSISGGATYLKKILKRLPAEVEEPHRTWMALASYNAGFGHIRDARKITELEGDNPNNWFEVKKRLPLLQDPEYYKYTLYGYARGGRQAPIYVENIRRYYDVLVWATESRTPKQDISSTTVALGKPMSSNDNHTGINARAIF